MIDKDKEFERLKQAMTSIRGAAKDVQTQYEDWGYLELDGALSNLGAHVDIARTQVQLLGSLPKPVRAKTDNDLKTAIQEFPDRTPEVLDYELVYEEEKDMSETSKRTRLLYSIRDAVHALYLHDNAQEVTVHRISTDPLNNARGPAWGLVVRRTDNKNIEENLSSVLLDSDKTSERREINEVPNLF